VDRGISAGLHNIQILVQHNRPMWTQAGKEGLYNSIWRRAK